MKWKILGIRIVLALIVLGIGWVLYIQYLISNVQQHSEHTISDVGVVLGASLWGDEPSPALRERLDYALELYNKGLFAYMIVSGGYDNLTSKLSEAQGMKNYLVSKGISESVIIEENAATSTYENLLFSQQIMKEKQLDHAIVITHHYHGARARDIAKFLSYQEPDIATTGSKVLFMPWHRARESLAFTKWELQKWNLQLTDD